MSEPEFVTVTITAPDHEQLASICRTLVEERLAACANIVPQVHSIYHWDGAIEEGPEALAHLHTRADLFSTLETRAAELHPFDVPQVVALPMADVANAYGAWINDHVTTVT
ncbi:divalent-cation tolerance protein CutA [Luteococcus sp.]|uniref:divalent-cation tolerance protein CutA n=1 Tax=Luteococcus sp. TaxID=1969402 RepID=UPI0037354312